MNQPVVLFLFLACFNDKCSRCTGGTQGECTECAPGYGGEGPSHCTGTLINKYYYGTVHIQINNNRMTNIRALSLPN